MLANAVALLFAYLVPRGFTFAAVVVAEPVATMFASARSPENNTFPCTDKGRAGVVEPIPKSPAAA